MKPSKFSYTFLERQDNMFDIRLELFMHFDSVNYSGKKKSPTSYFLTLLLIKFLSDRITYIINKLYMIMIMEARASPAMVIIIASLDIDQTKTFWNRFLCLKFIFVKEENQTKKH